MKNQYSLQDNYIRCINLTEHRLWFLKSYIGRCTEFPFLSFSMHSNICSVSKASAATRIF
ncbi:hypothetical protein HanXRQr2_Chr14g0654661 [Helianthus annuus]|uniref:Uncharacterized protein n=1 Tax=Helianthus annuus TaxID=4232 RepID=A0A9K3ECJ2_HELAN|nr:hypothetical protein HanXRQr2_Chr14g0654661 [Helianthus annuus]KAJ0841188.1 hypothetical protein HanPSC8_Chr14g0627581 [Helianthus annuus]